MGARQEFMDRLEHMPKESREYLKKMFLNCPDKVMEAMQFQEAPKGRHLVNAGDICESVYLLLRGRAKGSDLFMRGNTYSFREYTGLAFLGDYEVLGDLEEYRITIVTLTDCEIISIPSTVYLEWMKKDINALFMRTQMLMKTLTDQAVEERKHLFLTCRERLILYLTARYEKYGRNGNYKLKKTQSELAERIGFNVRTIQRNIYALEAEGVIGTEDGKVCITKEQYEMLKNMRI